MKKKIVMLLAAAMSVFMLGGCGGTAKDEVKEEETKAEAEQTEEPAEDAVDAKGVLMMATTTSTADTGLLDYLAPIFQKDTGWELAVGCSGNRRSSENGRKR